MRPPSVDRVRFLLRAQRFFLPPISYRSYRVWQRNRDVFLRLWKTETGLIFAEPFFVLLAMGFGLGSYVTLNGGQGYLEFIAPGIIASYAMWSAAVECTWGSYIRMEQQKTYDAIIVTPVDIEDVIAGEILWGATRALITACAILVVAALFGLVHSPWALLVPAVAVVEGLMFGSISMFFTSVAPSIYAFNFYYTIFLTPMFFFSSVFFPLSGLPPVVQQAAWFIPLTPVVNLTRSLVSGQLAVSSLADLAWVGLLILLFFPLAVASMRRRLII